MSPLQSASPPDVPASQQENKVLRRQNRDLRRALEDSQAEHLNLYHRLQRALEDKEELEGERIEYGAEHEIWSTKVTGASFEAPREFTSEPDRGRKSTTMTSTLFSHQIEEPQMRIRKPKLEREESPPVWDFSGRHFRRLFSRPVVRLPPPTAYPSGLGRREISIRSLTTLDPMVSIVQAARGDRKALHFEHQGNTLNSEHAGERELPRSSPSKLESPSWTKTCEEVLGGPTPECWAEIKRTLEAAVHKPHGIPSGGCSPTSGGFRAPAYSPLSPDVERNSGNMTSL